jgi:hypothetical protein
MSQSPSYGSPTVVTRDVYTGTRNDTIAGIME